MPEDSPLRTTAELGKAVQAARRRRRWSQERLGFEVSARRLRQDPHAHLVPARWIAQLEAGRVARIGPEVVDALAAALDVSPVTLLLRGDLLDQVRALLYAAAIDPPAITTALAAIQAGQPPATPPSARRPRSRPNPPDHS